MGVQKCSMSMSVRGGGIPISSAKARLKFMTSMASGWYSVTA